MISSSLFTSGICFFACHGGPADHFATYAESLVKEGNKVEIYATGPAFNVFERRGLTLNKIKGLTVNKFELSKDDSENKVLAENLAKRCCLACDKVVTDVGHAFSIGLQEAFKNFSPKTVRFAYYDNPEPFVPGGYSATAAKVIEQAQKVLFANGTLENVEIYSQQDQESNKKIDLSNKERFTIGYYPLGRAQEIAERRRLEQSEKKDIFLKKYQLEDKKNVFVYFGGNNDEYFLKALPAFFDFVGEASKQKNLQDLVIVIQQHPGAKEKQFEQEATTTWMEKFQEQKNVPTVLISPFFETIDAQIVADAAFYYQTSMGPEFVLAGIPVAQIGHQTYADIIVRNELAPSITNKEDLLKFMDNLEKNVIRSKEDLSMCLGIKENWKKRLMDIFNLN